MLIKSRISKRSDRSNEREIEICMLDFFKDLKDIERNAMNIFTGYNTLKL